MVHASRATTSYGIDILQIETLPTRNPDVQPLQNVLSISTAGKNRYLLHFNSLHSLTQWTAGIRLAMFEHSSLQELYTGSLIAGKGKHLNNIRTIMERSRFRTEEWCRVSTLYRVIYTSAVGLYFRGRRRILLVLWWGVRDAQF